MIKKIYQKRMLLLGEKGNTAEAATTPKPS